MKKVYKKALYTVDMAHKIALITGASSGIGRQLAYVFAEEKYELIITYNQEQYEAERTKAQAEKLGAPKVTIFQLNLADSISIRSLYQQIKKEYPKIDVLINNAGVVTDKLTNKQSFEEIEYQLRVNLEGLIKLTSLFVSITKQAILNIASVTGIRAQKYLAPYSATKFGVRGFTQSLAKEFPNLLIYSINPGLTATRMTDNQGVPAIDVAKITLNALKGKYAVPSGGDINIEDLLTGHQN